MIPSASASAPERAERHELGFTLPDVLIGMAIFGMLTMVAVRALIVVVDVGAEGDRAADRRQDIERVADLFSLDVARAEGVAGDLAPADYEANLDLVVDEATSSHIAWLRLASGDLVRQERTGDTVTSQDTMLEATVDPPFSYHNGTGTELDPLVDGATVIAQCTTRVRVELTTTGGGVALTSAVVDAPLVRREITTDPCP